MCGVTVVLVSAVCWWSLVMGFKLMMVVLLLLVMGGAWLVGGVAM